MLFAMNMKGTKNIGIKKAIGNAQPTEHVRQNATASKRHHMHGPCAYLNTLKGFGGKAAPTMIQAFQHEHVLVPLNQMGGGKQAPQTRADDDSIIALTGREDWCEIL
ncbi:hypothetical protein KTH_20720 [Thermosporothrix hazakensis]|uniref:Uncharacterized protein n=1 Tax=Thermosporothrix sp. COM3 TaxID=2490863 RepID=A0A455SPT4_9CHLR|nr:hypothetical protein KTC_37700 [Thermosporothrix sp. COM3]GCE47203.1 hypothetical protein KTH_20720 [Thermosporothrix hazakensis]